MIKGEITANFVGTVIGRIWGEGGTGWLVAGVGFMAHSSAQCGTVGVGLRVDRIGRPPRWMMTPVRDANFARERLPVTPGTSRRFGEIG